MISPINASTINSDDADVIPFPCAPAARERRRTLWIGALPFRPRRTTDYAWVGHLANDPLEVFIWRPFLLSGLLHAMLLFLLCHSSFRFHYSTINPIEVDLTGPYELVPANLVRWSKPVRKGNPDGHGSALEEKPQTLAHSPMTAAASTKPRTPPASIGSTDPTVVDAQARRGSLTGPQEGGEVALVWLTALPELMNRQDLSAGLRRFYPEAERRAGHEASVVLDLHISARGDVTAMELVRSGGTAFDQAAMQVAKLFRFSPARIGDKPVPVRLHQTISFRLQD